MKEQFECANCCHVGQLNQHGKCEMCGSCAVVSVDRIEVISVRTMKLREREPVPA